MPSDTLSITVATGLGVSVLAGIISGVCFVIGYRKKIRRRRNRRLHCSVCGESFRSLGFVLGSLELIICNKCNTKACKSTCASLNGNGAWVCQTCSRKPDGWIDEAYRVIETITKALRSKMSLIDEPPDENEEDLQAEKAREKEQVRDFIERLVNNLLGENVDDACINKIYEDSNYLPVVGDSPCSAHSALKLFIQKIIREANDLPKLNGEVTTSPLGQENRTYEDLLSAAIINKIISSSQNSVNLDTTSSSRANSVCSHRSSSSRRRKLQKQYFLGEKTLESKWKNIDTDTASVSSLDEWVHSDSSLGSTKYVDRVTLTIKQHIEEVSSSESDQEENGDVEYFRSNSAFGNNEPNWFLQKRQFRGSPVPVPMLVPDPKTEAKVLIGDKEVDETSDLSDVPSDSEEHIDSISSMDVTNHLCESKTLIGGKNPLVDFSTYHLSDDDVSADSGVKECRDFDEADSEAFSTSIRQGNEVLVDASISSEGSNTERDTEYTEQYATLPRTILISPRINRPQENTNKSAEQNEQDNIEINNLKKANKDNTNQFTGVYSQREKEKWKHAVELKHNPYSKENIERRIKSRNSIKSLFGSDYYVRQACLPSGAKRSEENNLADINASQTEEEHSSNGFQEEVENSQPNYNGDIPATEIFNEYFDKSNLIDNSLENSDLEFHFSSEITSDSDISLVNHYDVAEAIVYRKLTGHHDEEIQIAEKFFDFESQEPSLDILQEVKEQEEQPKPIAKPRKRTNSDQSSKTTMQTVRQESDFIKLSKFKDTSEDSFDIIPYIINKRSDNTLIKKIYSNPSVRSFALNNRNRLPIPVEEPSVNNKILQNKKIPTVTKVKNPNSLGKSDKEEINKLDGKRKLVIHEDESAPIKENILKSSKELEANTEFNGGDHLESIYTHKNKHIDSDYEAFEEIIRLKEQKLVANRLKELSKSSNNLSRLGDESQNNSLANGVGRNTKMSADLEYEEVGRKLSGLQNRDRSTSVKDLRKRFEQFDANAKGEKPILYSLTGRSISKQFKDKLRDLNGDIPSLSQMHSLSLTNLEMEENTR